VPHHGTGVAAQAGPGVNSVRSRSVSMSRFTARTVSRGARRDECPERGGYDACVTATEPLEALLRNAFPDASDVAVEDRTGGGDHFQVTVSSGRFTGLSLVEQHRLVYDALAEPLADGSIHELRIRTRPPAEGGARP
jgi:stress-induced morphogen